MTVKAQRYLGRFPVPFTDRVLVGEQVIEWKPGTLDVLVPLRKIRVWGDGDEISYLKRNNEVGIQFSEVRLAREQITAENIQTTHSHIPFRVRWEPSLPAQSRK